MLTRFLAQGKIGLPNWRSVSLKGLSYLGHRKGNNESNLEGFNQLWLGKHPCWVVLSHSRGERREIANGSRERSKSYPLQARCRSRRKGSALGPNLQSLRI